MLSLDFERAGITAGCRVLDLGCGTGRHAFAAWKNGAAVVAFDRAIEDLRGVATLSAAMLEAGEVASIDGGVLAGDACFLPFADQSFDVVVASEIFEHLHDDAAAMSECARVLRTGGVFVVTVPRAGPEAMNWLLSKDYHTSEGGHVRIYRRAQLRSRLRAVGFFEVAREYRHGLHSPYWWLRCALGVNRPERRVVAAYHRLLVWEIVRQPRALQILAKLLDPLIGKSIVVYLRLDPATPPAKKLATDAVFS